MKSDDKALKGKGATLTEADIASERVSRRSLLTKLGLGAGVAAATVAGATGAQAYHSRDEPGRGRHCTRWTQADPVDPYDPRPLRRCSDND